MYYEINVAKDGQFLFCTDERSCRAVGKAQKVYEELVKRFPAEEGFDIAVIHREVVGQEIGVLEGKLQPRKAFTLMSK